jgi:hypothetical protein
MLINIFMPFIEVNLYKSFQKIKIKWDTCCCCCKIKTRKKVKQDYIDLYSGPEFLLHYKYSFVLNVVFVSFMFGAGMPILFPIALCNLVSLYLVEKYYLKSYYRRPPMLDDTLNDKAIKYLMFAPILYFAIGFWMFNNCQLFNNDEI